MYPLEVSYGVSSSKNIIPMFSKNPRHWLIRFVIGCGQFWLLPRTAAETNELDMQRNQAGGAFRVCDGTKSLLPLSPSANARPTSNHDPLWIKACLLRYGARPRLSSRSVRPLRARAA